MWPGFLLVPGAHPSKASRSVPRLPHFYPLFSVSWLDRPRQRKSRVHSPAFAFVVLRAARSLLAVFATIPPPPPPRLILGGVGPGAFPGTKRERGAWANSASSAASSSACISGSWLLQAFRRWWTVFAVVNSFCVFVLSDHMYFPPPH